MRLKTLEGLVPENNFVLIKPHTDYGRSNVKGFSVDTTYDPHNHAARTGTVIAVPDKLNFVPSRMSSLQWGTEMELQVGDEVTCHYLSAMTAQEKGHERYVECDGQIYYFVKYDRIYTAKRDFFNGGKIHPYLGDESGKIEFKVTSSHQDEMAMLAKAPPVGLAIDFDTGLVTHVLDDHIICLNGFVLIEPVQDVTLKKYENYISIPQQSDKYYGIVRYMGSLIWDYGDSHRRFHGPDQDNISIGDVVIMDQVCDIPLEYGLHARMKENQIFYRVQRRYILGKLK